MLLLMSNSNKCCINQVKKKGKRKVIGVLDIYGFEIFKVQTVVVNLEIHVYAVGLCSSNYMYKTSAFSPSQS